MADPQQLRAGKGRGQGGGQRQRSLPTIHGAPRFGFTGVEEQAPQESTPLLRAAEIPPELFWRRARRNNEAGWLPADHRLVTRLVFSLVPLLIKPPPAPILVARRPEPLAMPTCEDRSIWAGRRAVPARIIDVTMFGFEVDLLEIRLFELEDVVETHVVWEGSYSQRGTPKPLILGATLHRFERFRDRMLYLAQDDHDFREKIVADATREKKVRVDEPWRSMLRNGTQASETMPGVSWINENVRRGAAEAWMRTDAWARSHGGREEEAGEVLFIFSDLDELPNARAINQLKHCEPLPQWPAGPNGQKVDVPPVRFSFGLQIHDLEHACCDRNTHWAPPSNIVILRPSDVAKPGMPMRYTGYPIAPAALGMGAHLSRCLPPAAFMLKSWLQCDTHEFRSDAEQRVALDIAKWYRRLYARVRRVRVRRVRVRRVRVYLSPPCSLGDTWLP